MKKFVSILKQNTTKYKIEIILLLCILLISLPIGYFLFSSTDEKQLDLSAKGNLEVNIENVEVIFSDDVFVDFSISEDFKLLCESSEYDCFMTIFYLGTFNDDFRRIGQILNLKENEKNEIIIPNDLVDLYNIDTSNFKVKLEVKVLRQNQSALIQSEEFAQID